MSEVSIRQVAYCPHCGNNSQQLLLHTEDYFQPGWSNGTESALLSSMFIARCETCHQILLYEDVGGQCKESAFDQCTMVFPHVELEDVVPTPTKKLYARARRLRDRDPKTFALLIRAALEAVCKQQRCKGKTLYKMLEALVEHQKFPPLLVSAIDAVRETGNQIAHADETQICPLQAQAIDEFFLMIIEYVYVAPEKLLAFRVKQARTK